MRARALEKGRRRAAGASGLLACALALTLIPAEQVPARSPADAQYDDAVESVIDRAGAPRTGGEAGPEDRVITLPRAGADGPEPTASGTRPSNATYSTGAPPGTFEIRPGRDGSSLDSFPFPGDAASVLLVVAPAIIALGAALAYWLGRRGSA